MWTTEACGWTRPTGCLAVQMGWWFHELVKMLMGVSRARGAGLSKRFQKTLIKRVRQGALKRHQCKWVIDVVRRTSYSYATRVVTDHSTNQLRRFVSQVKDWLWRSSLSQFCTVYTLTYFLDVQLTRHSYWHWPVSLLTACERRPHLYINLHYITGSLWGFSCNWIACSTWD